VSKLTLVTVALCLSACVTAKPVPSPDCMQVAKDWAQKGVSDAQPTADGGIMFRRVPMKGDAAFLIIMSPKVIVEFKAKVLDVDKAFKLSNPGQCVNQETGFVYDTLEFSHPIQYESVRK
jgi:hypothetical protein